MTARVQHFIQRSRLAVRQLDYRECPAPATKLVNEFVNETSRNDRDVVERSAMA
jgi:hypothetical protein